MHDWCLLATFPSLTVLSRFTDSIIRHRYLTVSHCFRVRLLSPRWILAQAATQDRLGLYD
jgi:hypothetical protein